jgi:hypothetical protein
MAYEPGDRIERITDLMKPIDRQIMMCDDVQDLLALASAMTVASKRIFEVQLGRKGAVEIFLKIIEDLTYER